MQSIIYSIPYIFLLLFLYSLLFYFFCIKNRIISEGKELDLLCFIVFLLFYGLRGFVNTDWINYYPMFESFPTLWNLIGFKSDSFTFIEPGFILYSSIIKTICPNYFFWIFISTLIDICILRWFFKRYSKYYIFSFILFLVFYGNLMETNLMRNVKSIMLFMLSIPYLKDRKFIPYLLLNSIGVSFHVSSIIYLLIYPVLHLELKKKILWSIFIIGNVLFIFHVKIITPFLLPILDGFVGSHIANKILGYAESETYGVLYAMSLGHMERMFTYILILLFYDKLLKQNRVNLYFINAYILYFISFTYLSEISVLVERITLLFTLSYWIIYPNIYGLLQNLRTKYVFMFFFIPFSFMKIYLATNNVTCKYDNLLFGIEERSVRLSEVSQYFKDNEIW